MNAASIAGLRACAARAARVARARGMQAPWRESGDPYEVLVAAVMAQQTQMSRVMPSYERFVAAFPTVESLAAASLGDVIRVWAGMGYNQRAVRLHRAARTIVADGWPRDAAALAHDRRHRPVHGGDHRVVRVRPAGGVRRHERAPRARAPLRRRGHRRQAAAGARRRVARRARARALEPGRDGLRRARLHRPPEVRRVRRLALVRIARELPATSGAERPRRCHASPTSAHRTTRSRPPAEPQPKFEGSARWWRGRIIDALRALPPGESMPLAKLRATAIANGRPAVRPTKCEALLSALESHGLVECAASASLCRNSGRFVASSP